MRLLTKRILEAAFFIMEKFIAIDGLMKGKEVDDRNIVYVFWEAKGERVTFHDYKIDFEKKELTYLKSNEESKWE